MTSPLTYWLFRSVMLAFHIVLFSQYFFFFLSLISNFISTLVRENTMYYFCPFIFIEDFMTQHIICSKEYACTLQKHVASAIAGAEYYRYLLVQLITVLFIFPISLLIFCIAVISIIEYGVLKFPTIITKLSMSSFVSVFASCILVLYSEMLLCS